MKKLIAELMNHGFSERQAQCFIDKCFKTYMELPEEGRKKLMVNLHILADAKDETVGG